MMAGTIYTQLISTLKNNAELSAYMRQVFQGNRYVIEPDSLPCIMVDVTGNFITEQDMNDFQRVYLKADLIALVPVNNPEYAIVGNYTRGHKGILDVENDIRACLSSSYSLGGLVYDVKMDESAFEEIEYKNVMLRGIHIPLRILYSQLNSL
jgi:hypothetical protein